MRPEHHHNGISQEWAWVKRPVIPQDWLMMMASLCALAPAETTPSIPALPEVDPIRRVHNTSMYSCKGPQEVQTIPLAKIDDHA